MIYHQWIIRKCVIRSHFVESAVKFPNMDIERIEKIGRLFVAFTPIPFLIGGGVSLLLGVQALGLDIDSMSKLQALVFIPLMFAVVFGSGLLGALFGCLAFYCLSAWLLRIPRATMEAVIRNISEKDPKEKNRLVQRYYSWCLDRAYGQKN